MKKSNGITEIKVEDCIITQNPPFDIYIGGERATVIHADLRLGSGTLTIIDRDFVAYELPINRVALAWAALWLGAVVYMILEAL